MPRRSTGFRAVGGVRLVACTAAAVGDLVIRKLHLCAGLLGFALILFFLISAVAAESLGGRATVLAVRTAILWGMLALAPALVFSAWSGVRMAGPTPPPLIAAKRRRMPVIALIGLLVLLPCAVFLHDRAAVGGSDGDFWGVQALELVAGAAALVLMGLNIRDGACVRSSPVPGLTRGAAGAAGKQDWERVDAYIVDALAPKDPALEGAIDAVAAAGIPSIEVAAAQGRLLTILARMVGARRILEIGTLGGYSAICLARALPEDGLLVTLEYFPDHAAVARQNIDRAGLGDRVEIRIGPALETLPQLKPLAPFDLVFIDADKENNAAYLDWALQLTKSGSVIVVDNVVRAGRVINAESGDPRIQGTRRFFERLGAEDRLIATAIQTVGSKGWDGFAIAIVA